jgi:TonB family protein
MWNAPNRLFASVIFLVCISRMAPSSDSAAVRGSAMLKDAYAASEQAMEQPRSQSGQLTILTGSKPIDATYGYMSTGSIWREEILFPGFREIRVRGGSAEKIQRPPDSEPLAIYAAFEAIRGIKWLQLLSDEHVAKVKNQEISKLPARCVEIESKKSKRTVCLHDDNTLAELRSGTGWIYEYSVYSSFENLRLPLRIRGSENGSPVFELNLTPAQSLATGVNADDPSKASLVLGWCEGLTRPLSDKKIPPHYPEAARQSHQQGTVDLYGVVAADGHLRDLTVVRSAGSEFDRASLDAVSQWTYIPAMCGGSPVTSETVITVHYTLSP